MEEHPFPGLHISDSSFLDDMAGRSACAKCNKSRKYYCYTCFIPMKEIEDRIPQVRLPVKVDIIKHPKEVDGKSTGIHAAVLSPDVSVYMYPHLPEWPDKSRTLLVFPGDNSITVQELSDRAKKAAHTVISVSATKRKASDNVDTNHEITSKKLKTDNGACTDQGTMNSTFPFDRVVFIESTWAQTKKIYSDERFRGLQYMELKQYKTKFWRYQKGKPETYLATIEAIYYFFKELHISFISQTYDGEYDDLLFFYWYMYQKIRKEYKGGQSLKAYQQQTGHQPSSVSSSSNDNTTKVEDFDT